MTENPETRAEDGAPLLSGTLPAASAETAPGADPANPHSAGGSFSEEIGRYVRDFKRAEQEEKEARARKEAAKFMIRDTLEGSGVVSTEATEGNETWLVTLTQPSARPTVADVEKLPPSYTTMKTVADMDAITKDWKAGTEIPGVEAAKAAPSVRITPRQK